MTGDPLVSIRCLVYNHEPYLRQCLDGFVMQKTTFPFEAIVHDDASTDGSAAIIREYAEKYPDIIKPIYETENQWGKGTINKTMYAAMHPNSKYIASCEGDDYWTDPNKLQIQVDFLESHPDYYMTCHAFCVFYEDTKELKPNQFVEGLPMSVFNGRVYCTPSLDNYWKGPWFTQVLSIVRRKTSYVDKASLMKYQRTYDYITCYYMMKAGKCALFKDVMGVYRKHSGGVYTGRDDIKWTEVVLLNYSILLKQEKDRRVIPQIFKLFVYLFRVRVSTRQYGKALQLVRWYIENVFLRNALILLAWSSEK